MRYGLILLALLTLPARAEDYLAVTLGSKHTRGDYNEVNPGLGLERHLNDRWALVAGYYYNSNRRDSFYAGAIYTRWRFGEVKVGTSLGIVTGYGRPIPMLAPIVMWRNLNFLIVPPVQDKAGVVALQVKFPLD